MPSVYIETSIISRATAWPSSDPNIPALQKQARDWWRIERPKHDLATSQLVIAEASIGDPEAIAERLRMLAGIPLVPITDEVRQIADLLVSPTMLPQKAAADALHVAAAAVARIEHLLTQNCRHIANAHTLPRVYAVLATHGYGGLLICTPAEFLGDEDDVTGPNS